MWAQVFVYSFDLPQEALGFKALNSNVEGITSSRTQVVGDEKLVQGDEKQEPRGSSLKNWKSPELGQCIAFIDG